MHKVQLLSESTSGLNSTYSICCRCSLLLITCSYFLGFHAITRVSNIEERGLFLPSHIIILPGTRLLRLPPLRLHCVVQHTHNPGGRQSDHLAAPSRPHDDVLRCVRCAMSEACIYLAVSICCLLYTSPSPRD